MSGSVLRCLGLYLDVWECVQMSGSVLRCLGLYLDVWECT